MLSIQESQNIQIKVIHVGNQIELAKEYIRIHYPEEIYDVNIIVFEDEGFSGGNTDRPHFQEMLNPI